MPLTIHSIATTQAAVMDLWYFSGKEEAISLFCCLLLFSLPVRNTARRESGERIPYVKMTMKL